MVVEQALLVIAQKVEPALIQYFQQLHLLAAVAVVLAQRKMVLMVVLVGDRLLMAEPQAQVDQEILQPLPQAKEVTVVLVQLAALILEKRVAVVRLLLVQTEQGLPEEMVVREQHLLFLGHL